MFRVILPSPVLYATPEQLPRLLANIAETRYVSASGEFLQTTTTHEAALDVTTATLLIRQPLQAAREERDSYQEMWQQERRRAEKLEGQVVKARERSKKRK